MKKTTMKNILCAISICMFVAGIKSAESGIFKSKENQIVEVIGLKLQDFSQSNPTMFSHQDLMNIGLACAGLNKSLCASAGPRKKYVLNAYISPEGEQSSVWFSGDVKWHSYGSRADYKKAIINKRLSFGRLELGEQGMIKRYVRDGWNFDSELSYKSSPFYKSHKELCCFGLAWIQSRGLSLCKRVVLYSACLTGHINPLSTNLPLECSLRYESKTEQYHESLIKLLNFPHLLKIILNMPYDYFWNGYEYGYRFELENIILPDNYKECVESNEEGCYKAFAELPEKLKAALEKRYKEQPK